MTAGLAEFEELGGSTVSCKLCRALLALPEEERPLPAKALAAGYGPTVITRWLAKRDIEVSEGLVRKRREKRCPCLVAA